MHPLVLSESAIAVLRFRLRRYRMPFREERRAAFEELAAAGLMEPDGAGDFRLTGYGLAHGEEIEREQGERVERERYAPPDADPALSDGATALLRRLASGERVEVTDANRPAFRELMAARIVMLGHSFAKGRESAYRFTYWGYRRRFELAGISRARETA